MEKQQPEKFYMVFMEGGHTPTYKHETLEKAITEAKRLAKTHEKKTYILATIKSFELDIFKVEDVKPKEIDGLPF